MAQGILIIAVFLFFAFMMYKQKISTFISLMGMAILVALIAGVPLYGKDGMLNIIESGSARLGSSMMALIFGAWLGEIMNETGITKDIIRRAAELGGDRPVILAVVMGAVVALLFTALTGLGATIMVGMLVLPILSAVGIKPVVSAGIFLIGRTAGGLFNLAQWHLYVNVTGLPVDTIKEFAIIGAAVTAIAMLAFIFIELKIRKTTAWSLQAKPAASDIFNQKIPVYALLTPLIPFPLVIGLKWPIVPALLVGVLFGTITTSWRDMFRILTKTVHDAVKAAAPAIVLYIAIGIVLISVGNPVVGDKVLTILNPIMPTSAMSYIIFFSIAAPLCLYRGPMNLWGMGSGVIGLMIAAQVLPPMAVVGAFFAAQAIQLSSDPTNTHNVWTADFLGIEVNDITKKIIAYMWLVAIVVVIAAAMMYL